MEKMPETMPPSIINEELKKRLNSLKFEDVIIDGSLEVLEISNNLHSLLSDAETEEEWDNTYDSFMKEINNLDDEDLFGEVVEGIKNTLLKKSYLKK